MANEEHVAILKQGVEVWNAWREQHPDIRPNLMGLTLKDFNLTGVNLANADLFGATLVRGNLTNANLGNACLRQTIFNPIDLSGADLQDANLIEAYLGNANLSEADLEGANLDGVYLVGANLTGARFHCANLSGADLRDANLSGADLNNANLSSADLSRANLSNTFMQDVCLNNANLHDADLSNALCCATVFGNTDLSHAKGLDTIDHCRTNFLDIATLYRSKGNLSDRFLRGCGVPEPVITYLTYLVEKGIEFHSCSISYHPNDKELAQRLHDRLQGEGIRCWLDEQHPEPADQWHQSVLKGYGAFSYDKLVLCCSQATLTSEWFKTEVDSIYPKEIPRDLYNLVIPLDLDGIPLDDAHSNMIAVDLKQHMVANFTNWKDPDSFEREVRRLLTALRMERGEPPIQGTNAKPAEG